MFLSSLLGFSFVDSAKSVASLTTALATSLVGVASFSGKSFTESDVGGVWLSKRLFCVG